MTIKAIQSTLPKRVTAAAAAAFMAITPLAMSSCANNGPSDKFIKSQNRELPEKFANNNPLVFNLMPKDDIGQIKNLQTNNLKEGGRKFIFNLGKNQIGGNLHVSSNGLEGTSQFSIKSPVGENKYDASFYFNDNAWITKVKDKDTGEQKEFKLKIEKEDNVVKLNAYDKDEKKIFSEPLDRDKFDARDASAIVFGIISIGVAVAVIRGVLD